MIIALVFAVIVGCSHAQQSPLNICENVADNIFLADVNNCTNYYICIGQKAFPQKCDGGRFFNAKNQSCEVTNTGCVTCDPSKLQILPMPKTCNKYIMCFSGTPVVKRCCDDLQFNESTGLCDLQTTVDCVDNNCAISDSPNNIVYVPSAQSNSKYYICMAGTPYPQACGNNFVFNSTCNCCRQAATTKLYSEIEVESPFVKFDEPIVKPIKFGKPITFQKPKPIVFHQKPAIALSEPVFVDTHPTSVEQEAVTVDFPCPEEGTHFYPHDQSASKYIICVNGKAAELHCAAGLFYDAHVEDCRELKNILTN